MGNAMEKRIKIVMSAVLEIPIGQIKEVSSPDTIESWDSLKHMNLIVALEEEFNIEFDDEEIVNSVNYALILNIIKSK